MKRSLALALLVFALAPRLARAQATYRSAPTGGRSALMGQTGVALGQDGSAPFVNPATIVRIHDANLAFSVNFYSFNATHLGNWHQPGAVDASRFGNVALDDTAVNADRFDALPSTLCLFFTLTGFGAGSDAAVATIREESDADATPRGASARGRQKLALCLGSTERDELSLTSLGYRASTPSGDVQQAQSLTRRWSRFHLGPTYALAISDDAAIGVSIHGVYTSTGFINTSSSVTLGAPGGPIGSELGAAAAGHSVDLVGIIGATYRYGRFTFGVSAQLPAMHAFGAYDADLHSQYGGAAGASSYLANGQGSFEAPPAPRVAVGVGLELRKLKVEIDETYYFAMRDALRASLHVDTVTVDAAASAPSSVDVEYRALANPVLNTSVGAEYFVSPAFSVLGGVSTDLTATPSLAPTTTLADLTQSRTNRVALSMGIGSYGEAGELLLGTELSYGWGTALAANPYVLPNQFAVVDTQSYGAMLILAGSTNLRSITRAVEKARDIMTGPERK